MSAAGARTRAVGTVTVVGASGLIGTRVVAELRARGHRVLAASRRHGVDTLSGAGLDDAVREASVVVDVTNPGPDADVDPLTFFTQSTQHLLGAEMRTGVRHHVLLSIVGTDRLADLADHATTGAGYFHAKRAQENLVRASGIPYTIIRSTQFFEFVTAIAAAATDAGTVRVPPAWLQPVAAGDVARVIADVAEGPPRATTIEVAGPAPLPFNEAVALILDTSHDKRPVVTDPTARYFGVPLEPSTLLPRPNATLGVVTLPTWVATGSSAAGSR